jgi:hypothetical protein
MATTIDVKQAVQSATGYFSKLMTVHDVRLEEVEISEDERFWHVTLSGLVPAPKTLSPGLIETQAAASSLAALFNVDHERVYKLFSVDSVDGSIRSMKIRQL